uniref:Uncharacterized protein LOC111111070 isoform X1 n=2 Tax=Crassostrea virginica TaxID=6565 RepID=A0A8B8BL22_CRAVI|nr:uncharacterized protein LOC111111070 isoform X1 [Crassostrea virginica]
MLKEQVILVFQCGKFHMDPKKLKDYLNPKTESVDDVLKSPEKRTVSVKGILKKVSEVIESPNSKRRELRIESMEGSMSVVCKLWGDSTNIDVPPVDTILTAQHMEVSQYKGTIYLNSSVLSSLKETKEESLFEGEIEAIEIQETYSFVIVNSKTMKLPNDLLETVLPNKLFQEGVFVRGKCTGMTITEMKKFNPAKKNKKD